MASGKSPKIELRGVKLTQSFLPVAGHADFMARSLQCRAHEGLSRGLVIDHQYSLACLHAASWTISRMRASARRCSR